MKGAARIVRSLAATLAAPAELAASLAIRNGVDWGAVTRLVTIHGLAAHLHRSAGDDLARVLPGQVAGWLAEQSSLNEARIRRMHDELAAILGAAATAGIEVMPLKGAVLTTMPGVDQFRRPMADLDLLVRPEATETMAAVLLRLGYLRQHEANPRPTHHVFAAPAANEVVSVDEHPDNPRRVELHTELVGHLWAWIDEEDLLTEAMWRDSTPGQVLGQPARLPAAHSLLAHLAIHAGADLLNGRGRLIQWLDLDHVAGLAGAGAGVERLAHARLAFTSLALAQRALPARLRALDIARLARDMPAPLRKWAERVPLDHRSGLMIGAHGAQPHTMAARAERWAPRRQRLWVAYGERPLPFMLAMHGRHMARSFVSRLRYRSANPL